MIAALSALVNSLTDLLIQLLGLTKDALTALMKSYLRWLVRLGLVGFAVLFILCTGLAFKLEVLTKVATFVLLLLIFVMGIFTIPVTWFVKTASKRFPELGQTIQALQGLAFWILNITLLIIIFPLWKDAGAMAIAFIVLAILGIAYARFGFSFSSKAAAVRATLILCGTLILVTIPQLRTVFVSAVEAAGNQLEKTAASWRHKLPRRIEYDLGNIDKIPFFNAATGEPIVFFSIDGGKYKLFDGKGSDPDIRDELKPVQADTKEKIRAYLRLKDLEERLERPSGGWRNGDNFPVEEKPTPVENTDPVPVNPSPPPQDSGQAPVAGNQNLTPAVPVEPRPEIPPVKSETVEPRPEVPPVKSEAKEQTGTVKVPIGTAFIVRMTEELSSSIVELDREFQAILESEINIEGKPVIPRGAEVSGRVVWTENSGRVKGVAKLGLTLIRIKVGTEKYNISTRSLFFSAGSDIGRDIKRGVAITAIGAVIGAVSGGKKAAAIGAASGAGAGTVIALATRGKPVILPRESVISFTLTRPLLIKN